MKKIILTLMTFIASFSIASNNLNGAILKDSKTNKITTIRNFKGKTYIKLWASWCPVCLSTLPHVNELANDKNINFNVVTVVSPKNLGEMDSNDFKKWWNSLEEYKNLTVLLDENGYILKKIHVRSYPTNVFIDSKGSVVRVQPGALSNEQIKNIMSKIK